MFELIKKEMGITEVAARVQFRNGKTVYGVILDCLLGEPITGEMRFVPNNLLGYYQESENPKYVQVLTTELVTDIDTCLK